MNTTILETPSTHELRQSAKQEQQYFLDEIDLYLQQYPETREVDMFLHDLNGHIRGKRIDVSCLESLAQGCYFPASVYAMSLSGEVVKGCSICKHIGEPDQLCLPILGTLMPSASEPTTHAQLFLSMKEQDGSDCMFEPRNILKHLLSQLHAAEYFPVMTGELEFYLYPLTEGQDELEVQCYDLEVLDQNLVILEQIKTFAAMQSIGVTGIVSESSIGQYELNLQHSQDILKLADHLLALRRIVKQIAQQHGLQASFLAKPSLERAGSGLHFHMSLLDVQAQNVFGLVDQEHPTPILRKILAGLIDLMPASMAILAPNINSFRRFQDGQHVPFEATWDSNNRDVAIRLPCSDDLNRRLEYRVAGADVNPYLAIAVIFIGMLHGLKQDLALPAASHSVTVPDPLRMLPRNQLDALERFQQHPVLTHYLGERFMSLWYDCKYYEYQKVYRQITPMELQWGI